MASQRIEMILTPAEVAALSGPAVQDAVRKINHGLRGGERSFTVLVGVWPAVETALAMSGWSAKVGYQCDTFVMATLTPNEQQEPTDEALEKLGSETIDGARGEADG